MEEDEASVCKRQLENLSDSYRTLVKMEQDIIKSLEKCKKGEDTEDASAFVRRHVGVIANRETQNDGSEVDSDSEETQNDGSEVDSDSKLESLGQKEELLEHCQSLKEDLLQHIASKEQRILELEKKKKNDCNLKLVRISTRYAQYAKGIAPKGDPYPRG
jgi:hypothetical protein